MVTIFFLASTKITSPTLNVSLNYIVLQSINHISSDSMTLLSLIRLISLNDPNSLIPPAADKACKILELPVKVYMPGF